MLHYPYLNCINKHLISGINDTWANVLRPTSVCNNQSCETTGYCNAPAKSWLYTGLCDKRIASECLSAIHNNCSAIQTPMRSFAVWPNCVGHRSCRTNTHYLLRSNACCACGRRRILRNNGRSYLRQRRRAAMCHSSAFS